MTSIAKPPVVHPGLRRNAVGLTPRDYEGAMSTLCAGCGHDSITAALVQAFYELDTPPHCVVKLSGIGCSSKTTAYLLKQAHGFNGVHGRMPALATGVSAANRALRILGISGDGDSLSIGLGQLGHAIRRNVDMLYVLENNGVYGLTKGQFSASADLGSKAKKGDANRQRPIDPVLFALTMGATFVARSFSGDKAQLVPLLKAGMAHRGFAIIDVISPCVTFNDHEGSTRSYRSVRERAHEIAHADFVPLRHEITLDAAEPDASGARTIRMHDGSRVRFRALDADYDPTDRDRAYTTVHRLQSAGEVVTGLLYVDPAAGDDEMHALNATDARPLVDLPYEELCPGSAALEALMGEFV